MELHAVRRVLRVPQPHDGAVGSPGRHHELFGNRRPLDDQRVIARRLERVAYAGQHTRIVVPDPRSLAVGGLVANDPSPKRLPHTLMAEAHPEDGHLAAEVANRLRGYSRLARSA